MINLLGFYTVLTIEIFFLLFLPFILLAFFSDFICHLIMQDDYKNLKKEPSEYIFNIIDKIKIKDDTKIPCIILLICISIIVYAIIILEYCIRDNSIYDVTIVIANQFCTFFGYITIAIISSFVFTQIGRYIYNMHKTITKETK